MNRASSLKQPFCLAQFSRDSGELFPSGVGDLARVDLFGKFGRLFLLRGIEGPLVHAVRDHSVAQLAAGQLMQHQSFLTGVDHLTVVQGGVLFRQLRFRRQLPKDGEHLVVHGLGCVVVGKSAGDGRTVFGDPRGSALAGHCFRQTDSFFQRFQLSEGAQSIQVFPFNHRSVSSLLQFISDLIISNQTVKVKCKMTPELSAAPSN